MNNIPKSFENILVNIQNNYENAKNEIKNNTLQFLQMYKNYNLFHLIENCTNRGYSGFEWIDFWGVGGINSEIIIEWAYEIVNEQKLDTIIEPYFNNINHRLGISIKRNFLNDKSLFLPIELQKKYIDNKGEKGCVELETLMVSTIIDSHFNDNK